MTNYVGTTLNNLPPVLYLNGAELCFIYQYDTLTSTWITYSCTTSQLSEISGGGGGFGTCSMRQLFAAMAQENVLYEAFEALPSDVTNTYNIAWNHAFRMTIGDPFVVDFLQPAISYTTPQMANLFALALTFPL